MDRKRFLGNTGAIIAASLVPFQRIDAHYSADKKRFIHPKYLKPGDTIGITATAGTIKMEEVEPAKQLMESWGFVVQYGSTIGKKDFTFGGTDKERAEDFQQMLNN